MAKRLGIYRNGIPACVGNDASDTPHGMWLRALLNGMRTARGEIFAIFDCSSAPTGRARR